MRPVLPPEPLVARTLRPFLRQAGRGLQKRQGEGSKAAHQADVRGHLLQAGRKDAERVANI